MKIIKNLLEAGQLLMIAESQKIEDVKETLTQVATLLEDSSDIIYRQLEIINDELAGTDTPEQDYIKTELKKFKK